MLKLSVASVHQARVVIQNKARLIVGRTLASTAASASESTPTTAQPSLVKIPKLPFFGSMVSAISGLKMDLHDVNGSIREWSQRHGPFYTMGLPGLGTDLYGTVHVTSDPEQLMKVLKKEGSFPSGLIEHQWLFKEWVKGRDYQCRGFYGR
jgi:phospholipase/lecithinase/hemolysin